MPIAAILNSANFLQSLIDLISIWHIVYILSLDHRTLVFG